MSIKNSLNKNEAIAETTANPNSMFPEEKDPFDKPLEDNLIMNDTLFEEARNSVTVDGMEYSFLKPPYMNFDDKLRTKRKLREAYTQHEFLLLYGYSGCGKTTVLTQFHEKFPDYIHLITDFTSLSPANLIVKMGEFIGLPLKLRSSEIFTLQDRLRSMSGVMYLMDEVSLDGPGSFTKLELLRKIYMETHVPICICGVPRLYYQLYDSRHYDKYCSLITRLDEHEMRGMRREDAGNYLNMVAEKESLRFTYPAQQALIRIALSKNAGGIHAFTTIIGRCITLARVMYYKAPGRSFPDNTRCIRPAVPEGKTYPGAELILTPPATPEPVLIDEGMVSNMLNEYKSHFPTDTSESRKKS